MTDKYEPFNLERALAGEPVMTRDGKKAKIVSQEKEIKYPLLVVLEDEYRIDSGWYDLEGKNENNNESLDLYMAPKPKKKLYIVVSEEQVLINDIKVYRTTWAFHSKDEALKHSFFQDGKIVEVEVDV